MTRRRAEQVLMNSFVDLNRAQLPIVASCKTGNCARAGITFREEGRKHP